MKPSSPTPSPVKVRLALAALMVVWFWRLTPVAHAADRRLQFHAAPSVGELVCPGLTGVESHPPSPVDEGQPPPLQVLGPLAKPVVREQPAIDISALPGLALAESSASHPRRVAVWGDSHVAAGAFIPTLIQRLQAHGLYVGTGFLPPSMGRANVRLRGLRAYCVGPGWSSELAYTAKGRLQVGAGLINRVAEGGPASYLWLDLRAADLQPSVRRVRLVLRTPEGATVNVSVNDGPEQTARLLPGTASQTLIIEGDARMATLKLLVRSGRIVLHGFVLDAAAAPQVTVDVFGTPSSTVQGWANLDPVYLAHSLQGESYDAVVLEYGTNEGSDPAFDRDRYAVLLSTALENMRRVFPRAACLLVGPPDRGVLWRDGETPDILAYARIMDGIELVQAQVGARFGCAHWNWQALMGGAGGSYGWARNTPPLMGRDLTHLTAAGYRLTGEALARSLGF